MECGGGGSCRSLIALCVSDGKGRLASTALNFLLLLLVFLGLEGELLRVSRLVPMEEEESVFFAGRIHRSLQGFFFFF